MSAFRHPDTGTGTAKLVILETFSVMIYNHMTFIISKTPQFMDAALPGHIPVNWRPSLFK